MVYLAKELLPNCPTSLGQGLGGQYTVRTRSHTMSPAPQTNAANPNSAPVEVRDACGRFAKGNPGGPGNPYPRRVAALRRALLTSVTEDDMTAITKAVIDEARAGNIAAAKLLFQYVLGKPGSTADPDRDEGRGMSAQGLLPLAEAVVSAAPPAPKANGSDGKLDEPKAPAAPKANGSNGGSPSPTGMAVPTGSGREIDHWLDRQVRRTMEALGGAPLANGV
jgi:hypothetical protein